MPAQLALAGPGLFDVIAMHDAADLRHRRIVVIVRTRNNPVRHMQESAVEVGSQVLRRATAHLVVELLARPHPAVEEADSVFGHPPPPLVAVLLRIIDIDAELRIADQFTPDHHGGKLVFQMTRDRSPW